jgi:hypothetical protein
MTKTNACLFGFFIIIIIIIQEEQKICNRSKNCHYDSYYSRGTFMKPTLRFSPKLGQVLPLPVN